MTQSFVFVSEDTNRSSGGVSCKVGSYLTDNRYTVLELVLSPGEGAPLHVHQREDEIMLIIEGELEVTHSNKIYHALPGSIIVLPKGQPHAFHNTGQTPNRVLITAVPGGLDRYFEEINALVASGQATQEQFDEVNARYEIDFSPR